jgi:hypothetical protein
VASQLFYHYYGIVFGKLNVKVRILSAESVRGHVAVWAGVNSNDNVSWVQGGIALTAGTNAPVAYIERKEYGDVGPHFISWPLDDPNQSVLVKLVRTSWRHWKCVISYGTQTHEVAPVYIKGLTVDSVLEIWGQGEGTVSINGKVVKGSASG